MEIRVEDVKALRRLLQIGKHVIYQTDIPDIPGRVQKKDNDAVVVAKFTHLAVVKYLVPHGRSWKPAYSTITYKDILLQRLESAKQAI